MDFVDPSTQMSHLVRAIRMAQEELDSVVMQQEEVLQLASLERNLNSQLFLDWLDYRKHTNDIEYI